MTARAVIYTRISKEAQPVPKVEEKEGVRRKVDAQDARRRRVERDARRKVDEQDARRKVMEQEARCRKLAEQHGYEVGTVFVDDGVSAFRSLKNRPGYGDLKEALTAGTFDVLLVDRQDRLARDQSETLRFVAECKDAGIYWHSVTEGRIDLGHPMQVLMAVYRGGESEGYSAKIKENVARTFATHREQGRPSHGIRPFGYDKIDKTMSINKKEAALIRKGVAMILQGRPRWDVVNLFNESGFQTTRYNDHWRASTVLDILKRWSNAGLVEHKGEVVGVGNWPAIVPREKVEQVRAILASPARPSVGPKPQTLLSNIARCVCGERMHAHGMSWGRVYRCRTMDTRWDRNDFPGKHTAIKIDLLDDLARKEVVASYLVGPELVPAADADADEVVSLHEALTKARAGIDRLKDGVREGVFTAQEVAKDVQEARGKVELAIAKIDAAARQSAHANMLTESRRLLWSGGSVSFADAARVKAELGERFDRLSLDERRRLVAATVDLQVMPGRGVGRAHVTHLRAATLDAEDQT